MFLPFSFIFVTKMEEKRDNKLNSIFKLVVTGKQTKSFNISIELPI